MLHVHGKGGNFYSGPPRTLPPLIVPDRFVHLSLNLRCHDLAYSRLGNAAGIAPGAGAADGGMWERLDEGAPDIEAGVAWLRAHTGLPVVVVAHSAGGYFLADHSATAPPVAGRVFLSPLTSVRFPLSIWWPDPEELAEVGPPRRADGRRRRGPPAHPGLELVLRHLGRLAGRTPARAARPVAGGVPAPTPRCCSPGAARSHARRSGTSCSAG